MGDSLPPDKLISLIVVGTVLVLVACTLMVLIGCVGVGMIGFLALLLLPIGWLLIGAGVRPGGSVLRGLLLAVSLYLGIGLAVSLMFQGLTDADGGEMLFLTLAWPRLLWATACFSPTT